ncbi:MAG: HAMP domain-containing sensor histidine kinase [Bacteroidota bacterium]
MKLLSKLTLYNTLSKMAIVLLFIWLLPALVKDVAFQYTNYNLHEQEKKVLHTIDKNGIDYYFDGDSSYGSYTMLKEEYISLDANLAGMAHDTIETARRIIDKDTLQYRILTHVLRYKNKSYVLEIGKTLASIDQYNQPLQRVALYVLIALIALTLLIDLVFTRVLLRPLGLIIKTKLLNRKFPFRDEHPPVKTSTSDFKYLDNSLIDLMDKVKTAFEKERAFTSNASHELLTPLGILQNKMENLMGAEISEEAQEKIGGMMQTLNRLKKIVRSLLLIARIDNDQFVKKDRLLVKACVKDVLTELEDRIDASGIRVTQKINSSMILQGVNKDLLFQLIYNLVNNAIRYNKPNGSIDIREELETGKRYMLIIEDTGVGIDPKDLSHIFERFKKSGPAEGEGYGIGLSIVQSIAQYHAIDIRIASTPGSGTIISLVFPESLL